MNQYHLFRDSCIWSASQAFEIRIFIAVGGGCSEHVAEAARQTLTVWLSISSILSGGLSVDFLRFHDQYVASQTCH